MVPKRNTLSTEERRMTDQELWAMDQCLKEDNFPAWLALKHLTHKGNHLDFEQHPYQRKILFDQADYKVTMKSTQCGISEDMVVDALAHAILGYNCFYFMPNLYLTKLMVDERFRKSLDKTPYYKGILRAAKAASDRDPVDTIRSFDIGAGNITFAYSQAGAVSYPADRVFIDELDLCDPMALQMVPERLANSDLRSQWRVGNPTFPGMGIDGEYINSNQQQWVIKCPNGHDVVLDWFEHVVRQTSDTEYKLRDTSWKPGERRDINALCHQCANPIDRKQNGIWVPRKEHSHSGYHITQLFSTRITLHEILVRFELGLVDQEAMQRFWNGILGEAYVAKGAKVDREMILECVGDYRRKKEEKGSLIVAGVDVGKMFHYNIAKMLPDGRIKVINFGTMPATTTEDTKALIAMLSSWGVKAGIIDALPETQAAREVCRRLPLFFRCYFTANNKIDESNRKINQVRTEALDAVKNAFVGKKLLLPQEIKGSDGREFMEHLTISVRVHNKARNVYEWVNGDKADHYALSMAYLLMAGKLVVLIRSMDK